MTEDEEILVYDALASIQENSKVLAELVNRMGTEDQKKAYKLGVYVPAIKLQLVLGSEAVRRGIQRCEKMEEELASFIRGKDSGLKDL